MLGRRISLPFYTLVLEFVMNDANWGFTTEIT